MWKCDPNDIQACLNCQYLECIALNIEKDEEADLFEKEVKEQISKANCKNLAVWKNNRSDAHKKAKKNYRATEHGKYMEHKYYVDKVKPKRAYIDEYNKGLCYGLICECVENKEFPEPSKLARKLHTRTEKVQEYIKQLNDEGLIHIVV